MRLLHRDVEFDFSHKRTGNLQIWISLFSYLHYTVSLTRGIQRNESTTFSQISYDKNLCRNPKSTLTAHTRPTPENLDRNCFLWPRFKPFDEGQSRASYIACLAHAQIEFWVILPFPWQGKTTDSHFIDFFISVGPASPTSEIPHRLKFLAFKTCPNCIGRSWNSSTERPERQLHSWTAMFTAEHFRPPSLHEAISHLCLEKTRHARLLRYVYACRIVNWNVNCW